MVFDLELALEDDSIPDDATLTFKDKTITFADLRAMTTKQQAKLQAKIAEVETGKRSVDAQQNELLRLTQEAQQIHERLQQQAATGPRSTDDDAYEKDPFYEPVRKRNAVLEKRLDRISGDMEKLTGSLTQAATTWAEDRWDREYDGITVAEGKKKPEREELLKMAVAQRLTDRHGLPSVKAAWNRMSEADRLKDMETKAYERGVEEGAQRARIASMPQPRTISQGGTTGMAAPLADFDDLTARALADPDLRRMISETNYNQS